jgi:8-oxo-dGTP diphosphatase
MRATIDALIRAISPCDALEEEHIAIALTWIASGAPLCRTVKPAVPPQHLVAYFVLVDLDQGKLLLVDHKNAGLWLPGGGHLEVGEHPQTTVCRELNEELGIPADLLLADPFFLTVTQTVGATAGHTDVSLWYLLRGDSTQALTFDANEFYAIRWFAFDAIPVARADHHIGRFMAKLKSRLLE